MLPCYRGDTNPDLVRISPTFDHLDMELWILTHPVLRHTARVRALTAHLQRGFEARASLFAGERAATA